MTKHFSIAIDGPAGAGKSTIAREIAKKTRCLYLDTGAMYRSCAIWLRDKGVDLYDREAVSRLVNSIDIDVKYVSGKQRLFSDGRDVTDIIRAPEVSMLASQVSKYPEIRTRMVEMQRNIAKGTNVVMDGRDIGTKVLPGATVKIFLVADVETRAKRRFDELHIKGMNNSYDEVLADMRTRDRNDSTRECSPLEMAPDAVRLDTTSLSLDESIDSALRIVFEKIGSPEVTTDE